MGFLISLLLITGIGQSQIITPDSLLNDSLVTVKLQVNEASVDATIPMAFVYNKRTKITQVLIQDAILNLSFHRQDTLVVGSPGYRSEIICMKDSNVIPNALNVGLLSNKRVAKVAFPTGSRFDAEDDPPTLADLGYDKDDYLLHGMDAVSSPITALYQLLSRTEQSKRKVMALENMDKRKAVLSKLLNDYNDAGLIDLPRENYDAFVEQLSIPDQWLKSASAFELMRAIRDAVERYQSASP